MCFGLLCLLAFPRLVAAGRYSKYHKQPEESQEKYEEKKSPQVLFPQLDMASVSHRALWFQKEPLPSSILFTGPPGD